MQATDTATDRDFARKAATAARWAGRALWFVLRVMAKTCYVLIIGAVTFAIEMFKQLPEPENMVDTHGPGPGPGPSEKGHNPYRWNSFYRT